MLDRVLELIGSTHGSQKLLADYLGIRSSVITDWKSGRNKSYPKYAPQIADYYGVSLDWLSGLSDDKGIKKEASPDDPARPNRDRFQKMAATLSEEKYAVLLKVLEAMEEQ